MVDESKVYEDRMKRIAEISGLTYEQIYKYAMSFYKGNKKGDLEVARQLGVKLPKWEAVCEKYGLFPDIAEWKEKILFIETCEEKPVPEQFEKEVAMIKKKGVFDVVSGVLVGKPQDEEYYEEYKDILVKVVNNPDLPIVYNVNFGHATPRCVLQYGAMARVDMKQKKIKCEVM